jgi:hypothetical protein
MKSIRIKIRSIYATALTKLLLDAGYGVVDPSPRICERFGLELSSISHHLFIQDRRDLQGIEVSGFPEYLCQFITFLQERLLDATLQEMPFEEEEREALRAVVEFPGFSKEILDGIRRSVLPTLKRHHRFRIVNDKALRQAERLLADHPENRLFLEDRLYEELILHPLKKGGVFRLEHIRPSGKAMRPREGVLIEDQGNRMVLKRFIGQGCRYAGLDLPIQPAIIA